ncbi:hypothetical protein QTH90_19185 [Variovorax sp. J2P1-59]|uniref:hypothetical protein n=1 Tax=Variovorax flavidus TaxID=3053501 RepID=UPI002578A0B9|nr:hypothetical protein [Variovorax sp. J2P1-59]MDM0076542.1 hypothetical protein [Variovorax sp. J2P1-59]
MHHSFGGLTGLRASGALCSALIGAGIAADTFAETPPARFASVAIVGTYRAAGPAKNQYTLLSIFRQESAEGQPAGIATFGWLDTGEVLLVQYTGYVPSIKQAMSRRSVMTPRPQPLDIQAAPRYVMVCAWPLDAKKAPGKPIAVYGERDDANAQIDSSANSTLTTVTWVPVPAARAARNFAAKDYCGEIARTRKSSAPTWLIDASE